MPQFYTPLARSTADAIAALRPCPFAGKITPDQILTVLGEVGNIWPTAILADAIANTGDEPTAVVIT